MRCCSTCTRERAGLFIDVNHFFVTIGALAISLYLIFLRLNWHTSMVQSGIVILALAVVFGVTTLRPMPRISASYGEKMRILADQKGILLLFIVAVLVVGVRAGSMGILPTFLAEVHGYGDTAAELGLVAFLAGVTAGRLVIGFIVKLKAVLRYVAVLLASGLSYFTVLYFVDLGRWTYLVAFLARDDPFGAAPADPHLCRCAFQGDGRHGVGHDQGGHPARRHHHPVHDGADRWERLDASFPDHLPTLDADWLAAGVVGGAADGRQGNGRRQKLEVKRRTLTCTCGCRRCRCDRRRRKCRLRSAD